VSVGLVVCLSKRAHQGIPSARARGGGCFAPSLNWRGLCALAEREGAGRAGGGGGVLCALAEREGALRPC
jgi:hypothetical protein